MTTKRVNVYKMNETILQKRTQFGRKKKMF